MEFKKRSEVTEFVCKAVSNPKYKKWNTETKKLETSQVPKQGFSKVYFIKIAENEMMEVSAGNLSEMLEKCFDGTKSEIINRKFQIKNNNKTGKEIRYFFNLIIEDGESDIQ